MNLSVRRNTFGFGGLTIDDLDENGIKICVSGRTTIPYTIGDYLVVNRFPNHYQIFQIESIIYEDFLDYTSKSDIDLFYYVALGNSIPKCDVRFHPVLKSWCSAH